MAAHQRRHWLASRTSIARLNSPKLCIEARTVSAKVASSSRAARPARLVRLNREPGLVIAEAVR